jgi:hypothetical protein
LSLRSCGANVLDVREDTMKLATADVNVTGSGTW